MISHDPINAGLLNVYSPGHWVIHHSQIEVKPQETQWLETEVGLPIAVSLSLGLACNSLCVVSKLNPYTYVKYNI